MAQRSFHSIKGMPDMLPEQCEVVQKIERTARDVFACFGFREIRTPLLEETRVFTRSIGQDTDIVEKEMYSFTSRSGKDISLRPEGTASIIRAFIENGLFDPNTPDLTRLFYIGPMFRAERPQKGRLRQFHQIGAEVIGGHDPYIDAELIMSLDMFFSKIGVDDACISINSLGCKKDRDVFRKDLTAYLDSVSDGLCDNCKRRKDTNVLRVLDCKNPGCRDVVAGAPNIMGYLCGDCDAYYAKLKELLVSARIRFSEKKDLVRGLDYYTGVIFEVTHASLGAQDAIAAGGRYDSLCRDMGGADIGATGYAIGLERLMLIKLADEFKPDRPGTFVIPMAAAFRDDVFDLVKELRCSGICCEAGDPQRSFKSLMRKAHKEGREYVVIIGEEEKKNMAFTLKNMDTGQQTSVSLDELRDALKK
ncbi:MAG: histidine--tRNA ligase [Candidatus Omnitrophica bacterium]|nr:histidine--tRNA ligase [Candidatus Omnitrophota bacterium]MDD5488093.1 histidine--tRNA ligase [Candidatus Omnitrophota bacterium]